MFGPRHCCNQRLRWITAQLGPPGQRQRARCGQPDAQAGEAAGAERDCDPRRLAFAGQRSNHRHQSFGMAAAQNQRGAAQQFILFKQGDRTAFGRAFDHQQSHPNCDSASGDTIESVEIRPGAAIKDAGGVTVAQR